MMEKISRKGFLKIAAAAAMSGVTAAGLAACNAASSTVSSATGIYTPGTYTATAKGMSEITATVTFDANTITKVELDLSGETESIGGAAKDKLIEQIMNAQTSQIDGVTGATVTSKAVQNAVADCIQQASGGAINPAQQSTEEASSSADWLGEAPEIAESDIKQTVDCEVLVVGAGSSGTFAAAAAAAEVDAAFGQRRFPRCRRRCRRGWCQDHPHREVWSRYGQRHPGYAGSLRLQAAAGGRR